MKDNAIIDDKCFMIEGWMVSKLKLKGNKLLIYAIIYHFCQYKNGKFTGSQQYLANWTNSTKDGCRKALKELLNESLIIKDESDCYNNCYAYLINWKQIENIVPTNENVFFVLPQEIELINSLDETKEVKEYLLQFLERRVQIGLDIDTWKMILEDFQNNFKTSTEKDKINSIRNTIKNKWKDIFPPRYNYSSKPSFDNTAGRDIPKGVSQMTPEERTEWEKTLAVDENGNPLYF